MRETLSSRFLSLLASSLSSCGSKDSHESPATIMSARAARLARLFTPEYARRINAQIIHPVESMVVKPNELESALCRPLHVAVYEPDRPAAYLAATLSYGIIKGIFP